MMEAFEALTPDEAHAYLALQLNRLHHYNPRQAQRARIDWLRKANLWANCPEQLRKETITLLVRAKALNEEYELDPMEDN